MAGCGDGRVGVWTGGKDGLACGPCWRVRLPSEEQEGLAGGEMLNWRQRSLDLIFYAHSDTHLRYPYNDQPDERLNEKS